MSGDSGRRLLGAVIVTLAMISVIVVPGAKPTRIAGEAAAVPVPGPPAIGYCAVEPYELSGWWGQDDRDWAYPSIELAPCGGESFGEVARVIMHPREPTVTGTPDGYSIDDPNVEVCWAASQQYLGADPIRDSQDRRWSPAVAWQFPALTGPSPRQQSDGQSWLACLIRMPGDSMPGDSIAGGSYPGTLRDAVVTGAFRDLLGVCPPGTDPTAGFSTGDCAEPHPYQLVAYGDGVDQETTIGAVTTSCTGVIRTVTGIDDVGAAGLTPQLTVSAPYGAVVDPVPEIIPPGYTVYCGVAADGSRKLDGGLFGLGNSPIPWA